MGNTEILSFVTTFSLNDSDSNEIEGVGNINHSNSHDHLNSCNTNEV